VSNNLRLRRGILLGAAVLVSACTMHVNPETSSNNDALLQRMLVAEDARGTGAEGIAPLLEGEKSSDTLIHRVAVRGLERLKWAPTPPAAPATAAAPARAGRGASARVAGPPCARLIAPSQSNVLLVSLAAADSLATCADDGVTWVRLSSSANDNIRAAAIIALGRATKDAHDSIYIAALSARGYQVVLAAAGALKGSPNKAQAVPPLFAALDRLTAERRENSHDERVAILDRLAEFGSRADVPRLAPYAADYDSTVAQHAAKLLTTWSGTTVVAHPKPLPIRPEPLARIFRTRGMQLRITMAESSGGGTILINLFNSEAPATIARVTRLAREHYYDGLSFHRFVPGFVIQGGSPGANEVVGDAQFMRDELLGHPHLRGTVGISTRGHDTGDAQFFINLVDNRRLDHDYTVFGEVVSGMDVVDRVRAGSVMARVQVIEAGNTSP
jgi:cyclophilin family peptidyl-prolyl cis-trans isomerase